MLGRFSKPTLILTAVSLVLTILLVLTYKDLKLSDERLEHSQLLLSQTRLDLELIKKSLDIRDELQTQYQMDRQNYLDEFLGIEAKRQDQLEQFLSSSESLDNKDQDLGRSKIEYQSMQSVWCLGSSHPYCKGVNHGS